MEPLLLRQRRARSRAPPAAAECERTLRWLTQNAGRWPFVTSATEARTIGTPQFFEGRCGACEFHQICGGSRARA